MMAGMRMTAEGCGISRHIGTGYLALLLAACGLGSVPAPVYGQTPDAAAMRKIENLPQTVSWRTSEEQFAALKRAAKGGTTKAAATLPDWAGLWTRAWTANPQHVKAPLRPDVKPSYDKMLADIKNGIEFDHLSLCLPAGYPRVNNEPFLREFIVRPDETWMITEQTPEIRRIYTDGSGHPPADEQYPLWEGSSIGFWDHDMLVVHTVAPRAFPSGYSRGGPPQSEQLSTVEEWRMLNKNLIEMRMTVYDPTILTRPFVVLYQYNKVTAPAGLRIDQWVCNENNNVVKSEQGGSILLLPGEPGYKDPKTLDQGTPPR